MSPRAVLPAMAAAADHRLPERREGEAVQGEAWRRRQERRRRFVAAGVGERGLGGRIR
jgi:hypothetical protein